MIANVIRDARAVTRSLLASRRLVWSFVRRDLGSRYAGSSLGFFWSVIQPLANLAIYMFVFQVVLKARWSDAMSPQEVSLVMLTGFVAWGAYSETLLRSTTCMVDNRNLIQKVVFPAEILPTFLSISSLVSLVVSLPIILVAKAVFMEFGTSYADGRTAALERGIKKATELALENGESVSAAVKAAAEAMGPELGWGLPILLLPLLIVLQWIFSTGVAFILSTLNVLVRDVQHVVGLVVMVWMFSTPIFYPATLLRGHSVGPINLSLVLELNPIYWLTDSYQRIVLYAQWPQWHLLGRFALVALIVYALGARLLMREKKRFPDFL